MTKNTDEQCKNSKKKTSATIPTVQIGEFNSLQSKKQKETHERAEKLNEKIKKTKEEKKNRNREQYEKNKRRMSKNTDEQCENSKKKRSTTIPTVQIGEFNSSQSKKRKQRHENNNSSKEDNHNMTKRRRTTNTFLEEDIENSQNGHMGNCTNILDEETEENNENVKNRTRNMDECLKLFNISISNGPVYVCTVCLQTWFRRSVRHMQLIKVSSQLEEKKLNQCRRYYISAENKEWICKGCRDYIKNGKIPKFSIENKMGFPEQPTELNLNGMEERLTSPRLTLFQMRDLPCGAQKSVRGNSVNLPIDIAPTVDMLPRTLDNSETIAINFKRRMCYKGCAFKKENIRPAAVWKAVNYLMTHSQMYKDLDIQLDTSWIRNIENSNNNTCQCNEENVENASQPTDVPANNEEENNENIDNIEEDEEMNNINRDTMLSAPETVPKELTFAPGEGQHLISVFHDPDAEYLSFPTIFCGQRRASDEERHTSVHYTEICKYELRSVDRRVASNIPNMFFKLKKVQMKHVLDRVSLAMRRVKGKGVQAKHVLDDESRARIVCLDEGFYIFRNLRNSPAYLEKRKKDAFAMIRQIGFPSLFISLSAAETKWPELLRAIGQLNDKKTYTDKEIAEMDTQKIFGLIQKRFSNCCQIL